MSTNNSLSLPEELASNYKLSNYNVHLGNHGDFVYNTNTQAIAHIENGVIEPDDWPDFIESFLIERNRNELEEIQKEYDSREQYATELHLILATTLDCQFRCFYCYEQHPKIFMSAAVKQAVMELVKKHAKAGDHISVVWYGGEPLLDFPTIEDMTYEFKEICNTYSVRYSASMISNGFLFDDVTVGKLDTLGIDSIQITIDGMREEHENRRPMINGEPSFDQIIENIIKIYRNSHAQVHLRINVDKNNIESAHHLLEYIAGKGLEAIDVNLGMLKSFGCDHTCCSNQNDLLSMKEFSKEFLRFRDHAQALGFKNAVSKMTPSYLVNSCTIDSPNSYVIDPHGFMYKCISLVGEQDHSIGNILTSFDSNAHTRYSPFSNSKCKNCKYLPVCKGGCLLNNTNQKHECNIWRFITEDLIIREIGQ